MHRINKHFTWLIVSLLITAVALLAACGGSDPTPTTVPTAVVPPTNTALPAPTEDTSDANETEDPAWARIQSTGSILVGMSLDYPPFESYTEDFEPTGYDVTLIQELAQRLGLEITIKDIAFDGLGNALYLDAIDVAISAISVSPERDAIIDFSNVYYISEDAFLSQINSGIDELPAVEDLADYRVGVQRGSIFEDWIRTDLVETGLMPEENLLVYLEAPDVLRDLREGRIELAVLDLLPAEKAVATFADIQIIGSGLNRQRYAIAMQQNSPLLQKAINETLIDMQNEGVLTDLAKEYLDLEPEEIIPIPPTDPKEPTPTPAPPPTTCIDHLTYVQDLNYNDENMSAPPKFLPGQAFSKGWRIKNSGTCTWDSGYNFVFTRGNNNLARMGGLPTPVKGTVAPGQTYDMFVDLVAPVVPGVYQAFWTMRAPSGLLFGESVWVGIEVVGAPTPTPAATQTPSPNINFTVNTTQIQQGQCVTFSWNVNNIQAVFFYPQGEDWRNYGVTGQGTSTQCPSETTTYELRVLKPDGTFEVRQITIFVTPSVTAPNIDRFTVEPAQISVGQCVTLRWEVSGNVGRVVISRDGTPLWDGAPVTGSMQDCPPGEGRRGYVIEATGSGGTSRRQRDVTVVVPTLQPTAVPPTPTPVIIPTATPAPPVITSFNVNPQQIQAGGCVSINWGTGGGTTYIRLLRNGSVIMDNAPHNGTIPDCLNAAGAYTYRLEASGNNQTVSNERRVDVSAATPPTPTANPLVDFNWGVTSLNGAVPAGNITSVFDNDGRISGNDGCNNYGGTYVASGSNISITLGISTGIMCEEQINEEAAAFREMLSHAQSYSIANNQLTLTGSGPGSGTILYSPLPQPR